MLVSEEEAAADMPAIAVLEPVDVRVPGARVVAIRVANRDTLYMRPSVALAKATTH
jgi:hypothetical protein